jgi:hypothetical protein
MRQNPKQNDVGRAGGRTSSKVVLVGQEEEPQAMLLGQEEEPQARWCLCKLTKDESRECRDFSFRRCRHRCVRITGHGSAKHEEVFLGGVDHARNRVAHRQRDTVVASHVVSGPESRLARDDQFQRYSRDSP